jgi:xylose dehydrogenase (NAD/NADP)
LGEFAMLNWGFIGAGSIARNSVGPAVHAATDNRLYAVAARDPNRARALEAPAIYDDYRALLADTTVDAVYIALHNSAHLYWVRNALDAGKHVLCEKPLGLSADDVSAMTEYADAAGRILVEAAWNRWHPRTRAWEDLLAAGELGEISQVITRFEGDSPAEQDFRRDPQLGGGALYDVGCYAVAAALAAFSWRTPQSVEAAMTFWRPGSADVITRATLHFANGGQAEVVASLDGGGIEDLRIVGSRGVLELPGPVYTAGNRSPDSLVRECLATSIENFRRRIRTE